MPAPHGFSWLKRPLLAALARPRSRDDCEWLRQHGIQVLLTLTEDTLPRDWVNEAGLMVVHEPIEDFAAPTQEQLDRCVATIARANEQKLAVAIHCAAGKGRTGTILAAWYVAHGQEAQEAIDRVRQYRPGSIETEDQELAVFEFARRRQSSKL